MGAASRPLSNFFMGYSKLMNSMEIMDGSFSVILPAFAHEARGGELYSIINWKQARAMPRTYDRGR